MLTKFLSISSYLLIVGLIIFLIMMLSESKSGSDPSTRGIGSSIIMLAIAGIVFLLLFNLQSISWLKYLGLTLGLLSVAALIVIFLALSGSSLVFQDTTIPYKPVYDDPKLSELFEAFQKGKVKQWKSLLQANPAHLHNQQLMKDILSDVSSETKSNAHKLESLKYMLKSGAKFDSSFCEAFVWIAYMGKADMTELLLQHGADANCIFDTLNKQPVIFKVIEGYPNEGKVIDLLIKYGADANAKMYDDGRQDWITPLLYAATLENLIFCKALIRNGASLEYKTKDGISIRNYILQKEAKIKEQGYYDANLSNLAQLVK